MRILEDLEPKSVFRFFEEICGIPHGSHETKAISDYLVAFANERSLKYRQEECNNVIIWKDGTKGYENAPTVMIQGHIDMVCEKEPDCTKDMSKEGLELFVDGDVIGARGTTLGGDDGIAVAIALAILDSNELNHGPLECVFTVDEEVGLLGAQELDASDLKAKYMLNIDSEKDKVLTVSCAGSIRSVSEIPVNREEFEGSTYELKIGGLKGGHSGEEIHLGRANSNILLGRALSKISHTYDLRLVSACGGNKENAIPRESTAVFKVASDLSLQEFMYKLESELKSEYQTADPDLFVKITKVDVISDVPMDKDSTNRVVCFMFCVPDGLLKMSIDVEDLVQTSTNIGKMYTEADKVVFSFLMRSSVNSQNMETYEKMANLAEMLGGKAYINSSYSAWEYQPESKLRKVMTEAFNAVYDAEPKIEALHAGLECGIISGKLPGLDCISYGPDLVDIHTTRERLHIASTWRIWNLTVETLKRLK